MAQIITVVSGKGGVGKSTIAAFLALSLVKKGKRVLAFDADIGLRNLDILLSFDKFVLYDYEDILKSRCNPSDAVLRSSEYPDLFFISCPQISDGPDEDDIRKICEIFKKEFDYIVIDAPAGIGRGFKAAVKPSDMVLVVATPDNTSVRDADRTAEILEDANKENIRLVINRADRKFMKKRDFLGVDDIIDGTHLRLIGVVPEDKKIKGFSSSKNVFKLKKSVAEKAVANIAERILGKSVEIIKL